MGTWINNLPTMKKNNRRALAQSPSVCRPGGKPLAFERLEHRALLSADAAAKAASAAAVTAPAEQRFIVPSTAFSEGTGAGGTATTNTSANTSTGLPSNVIVPSSSFGETMTSNNPGGVSSASNGGAGGAIGTLGGGTSAAATNNLGASSGARAGSSLVTGGAASPVTGSSNNGVGTNGQFGLEQGVNVTPNGQVTGNPVNTGFGSQNPGDAGMGAPGTTFNSGVGFSNRPGAQNPGDAGFGAPGTSFNPTGVPASQVSSSSNGNAAANTQATDAAFSGGDTMIFDPAVLQQEMQFAATHPIR